MKLDQVIAERKTKTVYRDGDKCIKVFNENHKKFDILNEALNHARIEATGIHVPELFEVTTIDGKWAIVMKYIPGKTLAQLIEENSEKKMTYLEQFVDIQLSIQSFTCPMLTQLKDKMKNKINQADLDQATRYDLQARLSGMPTHNKVCHGDFNPSNVILSEDGIPYVIDWSHVTQGNGAADAARTYLLFCLNGDIKGAVNYLDLFCKKSETSKQYVNRWMPIVAASQSVKGNAEERDFLLSWVNVIDYQ